MTRAAFLDRDGTINVERGHIRRPEDLALRPGALEGLRALQRAGFLLIVVTNQSWVGESRRHVLQYGDVTLRMVEMLGAGGVRLDGIFHCPHHPAAGCLCRKPAPGLILAAARIHDVDLSASVLIGDQQRDIDAGAAAGVGRRILLGPGATLQQVAQRVIYPSDAAMRSTTSHR